MRHLFFLILLATISFNCEKQAELFNGPINPPNILPTITTTAVTSITNTVAVSGGNISTDGGSAITARGVCWSTTVNPVATGNHTTDGSGLGIFTSNISGLTASTLYYVRAYAINSTGTYYGNGISFTTSATSGALATVTTAAASAITTTTATGGGDVTADGGSAVTARGVCWGTTTNPVIGGNQTTNGTGLGVFTSPITGLAAATIYYVRAYATNNNGTAYGNEISFTTNSAAAVLPTVTTTAVSAVTSTTAAGGGNVTADGGAAVTARGVCWSTTPAPVATGSHTTNGTGTGIFTSSITGMSPVTTYYVRAYATNSVGTAYGNEISFTTTTPDIYVAGTKSLGLTNTAGLWKNGIEIPLQFEATTTKSQATAVYVSGTDVYVVGYQFNGSINKPTIWKNGVGTILLPLLSNSNPSTATDVFVSDGDVYVTGNRNAGSHVPRVWKNGTGTDIGNFGSSAYSVFVDGTDVYVAGTGSNIPSSNNNAVVWKNAVRNNLASTSTYEYALSVYVSGTDVYAVGARYTGTPSVYKAVIWKNGVATELTDGTNNAQANSVFVSGTDVYVCGYEYNGTRNLPKLWKNGLVTNLSVSTPNAPLNHVEPVSVNVIGSDVYVIGTQSVSPASTIRLWKNGVETTLVSGGATSVVCGGTFVQ